MMKTLTIDINGICNLACEFCYQDLDGSELSGKEILRIVKAKLDFGIVEVGGGEPFMHPELTDIVEGIVKENRRVHLSTNATFIPKRFLGLDADTKDSVVVQVSLPAGSRESYQNITGKDFFDAIVKNAKILADNYRVVINMVVYQKNFLQVKEVLRFGYSLGIPARVSLVFPVGKGKNVNLPDKIQIDQLKGLLLVEKISHPGMVDSPLIHEINCPALSRAYGFQSKETCPLSSGRKEYYNPKGQAGGCEFHNGK